MRVDAPERVEEEAGPRLGEALSGTRTGPPPPPRAAVDEPEAAPVEGRPVDVGPASLSAFLSSAAAGFACAGLFAGVFARLVGFLGAAIGAGMVWLSYRTRRTALVQILTLPVAAVGGAALVLPFAEGGSANLPSLVAEALRTGGIAQPPVPFDPGWRFLLLTSIAVLAAAAAALAAGLGRPKLAVFVPVPVLFGALAAQSGESSAVPTVVTLVLLVGALAVCFGIELSREGASSARFEVRRFGKGLGAVVVLVAVLGGVTQLGFLYPEPDERQVIPPKRPEVSPPEPDRELFVVRSARRMPWRVGVLDSYDGRGWLTPPFDTARLVPVPADGAVAVAEAPTARATFTISDVRGHVIPGVANLTRVVREGFDIDYDPRTQTLRLPAERAARGMTYKIEAPVPPRGEDLGTAARPPPAMEEFLSAPPAPLAVADVLERAPRADLFARLQFVRARLYEKVVAEGAGQPTDVPPARVAALLNGEPGSPFEITAAEALLARWAGVPSRIGYGYFGGDATERAGETSIRPRHAATWLEAYFEGHGWVPVIGTPPRAQASLSSAQKNTNPAVRPSEKLTLPAYVPVRLQSIRLLSVVVQWWVARTLPVVALAALALWLFPGLVKTVRRVRRRRWAERGGVEERIRVAYAEFRDAAHDLGVGHPALTPLELLSNVEHDAEHTELAWLVTRCLWGDLARDLREEDAALADEMARSLTARLRAVHPAATRLAAYASRRSLRDPFTDEIPNLWPRGRGARPARRRRFARRAAVALGATLALAAVMTSCVRDVDLASAAPADLPPRIAPRALGELRFHREPSTERVFAQAGPESLAGAARVYSVHDPEGVVGALQVVAFKQAVAERQREARAGVLGGLGTFELRRVGSELIYTQILPEQHRYLWFPERGAYYELFIARPDFEEAGRVFADVLAFQRGERPAEVVVAPADPRRGFEG